MLQNLLPQVALVDVHIDFGCADVFVAEHGLDGSQVGPSLQELRGKTVAEIVAGRDGKKMAEEAKETEDK